MADLLVAFPKVNFQVVEGSGPSGYKAVVEGISGLIAYWRLGELAGTTLVDETVNDRDGTYVGTVAFQPTGLPADSDGSVDFLGTGHAVVPHGAGLSIPSVSISAWFRARSLPVGESGAFMGIVSKDQSGLITSDFTTLIDDEQQLLVQFQNASGSHRTPIIPPISADTTYHLCVRANASGFDAYLNGQYLGHQPAYTQGWELNTNAIEIGRSPTPGVIQFDGVIDEVAIYNRFITEQEVLALAQATAAPIADNDSAVVPESATSVLDVVNNDTFVGQKGDLTVEIVAQGSHGVATVRGDNDIDFAAVAVTADEADSFTYRITDVNGTSNTATVNLTVQNAGSTGGGTLVYDWSPLASWIDGVALASRDANDVHTLSRFTNASAATVGSGLAKAIVGVGGAQDYCFNRAPTGHPSIEIHIPGGNVTASRINFAVQLWNHLSAGAGPHPRHIRVVMEVKTCKSSDPTAFKGQGLGTTGGSYPNFTDTHSGAQNAAVKYMIGMYAGIGTVGGGRGNWYNAFNSAFAPDIQQDLARINRASARWQSGGGSKQLAPYAYSYDRPARFGSHQVSSSALINGSGITGVWHRIEIETKLTTPATVAANARLTNPPTVPANTGDGFVRHFITRDIDGELGTPGTRQQSAEVTGMTWFCRADDDGPLNADNMHTLANFGGPWFYMAYGGSVGSQAEGWAWIRRLQVFVHD